MDKSRLLFRGGVRSFRKLYEDGTEETFYYKARTPNEVAAYAGAEQTLKDDAAGAVSRQKHRAGFLVASLCNEDGSQALTMQEAEQIPGNLKMELVLLIINGSNEVGDAAGKD